MSCQVSTALTQIPTCQHLWCCRTGITFRPKHAQLCFGNRKFREATIQTDQKLWKHPHDWLVQAIASGEMNGDFPIESALMFRLASLAKHLTLLNISLLCRFSSVYQVKRVMCSGSEGSGLSFSATPNEVTDEISPLPSSRCTLPSFAQDRLLPLSGSW